MNIFTTDHPLAAEPSPCLRRFGKRVLQVMLLVTLYLLLLGPLGALDRNSYLRLSEPVAFAIWVPSWWIWRVPVLREGYWWYLDWWYHEEAMPYSAPYPWAT